MDFDTSLRVLGILCDTLNTPNSLGESLERITQMTGVLMETQQTVILLRDEDRQELIVRTCTGLDSEGIRVGHPLGVDARLKRILWRMRSMRQIGSLETGIGIEGIGFPILAVPLRVKGDIIGLLITGKSHTGKVMFDETRRRLFTLIATFAALVLENAKAYDYLRQRFAQHSADLIEANRRSAVARSEAEQLMVSSLKNPTRVARLLAVSFYKELVRAGFSPGHITTAAAEILDCIARQEMVAGVAAEK